MSANLINQFNQYSQSYDKATPIQSDVAFFLAEQISALLDAKDYQTWLDVGCGTGKLSQAVLHQISHQGVPPMPSFETIKLIGVDTSQAMLNLWQKNCQLSNQTIHLKPVVADMTALPFADKSVDLVMSSFALHWTTSQVVFELGRVLNKGGFMFLAIPVKGSFRQVSERFPKLPIYPFLASDDWQQAINQLIKTRNGKLVFFDERSFRHSYPNLKILLNQLKQMGGAVSGQSPVSLSVLRQYLQDNSPVDLDYQMLMIGVQLN